MLVVTEVGEAAEAVRHEDVKNFVEELADTVIRVFDIAGMMDVDIAGAISDKMDFNEERPHKHGKEL